MVVSLVFPKATKRKKVEGTDEKGSICVRCRVFYLYLPGWLGRMAAWSPALSRGIFAHLSLVPTGPLCPKPKCARQEQRSTANNGPGSGHWELAVLFVLLDSRTIKLPLIRRVMIADGDSCLRGISQSSLGANRFSARLWLIPEPWPQTRILPMSVARKWFLR